MVGFWDDPTRNRGGSVKTSVQAEICALRECIQDIDEIVAQMAANAEQGSPRGEQKGEDPSVFKSQAKGANLHELVF